MDVRDKWGEKMKEQRMSDLINRKDVIALIKPMVGEFTDNGFMVDYERVLSILEEIPSADRPQGYWIKIDVATYRCSECGKIQIADDVNELNFCCCCGSRNKIRRMKGADDETD